MKVPFLEYEIIWKKADNLRGSSELSGINVPPIDVLYLLDVLLGFDVIEISNLFSDIRMDAAIVPGQKAIYVDRDAIEGWERRDNWVEKRLRFSLAHELGHYYLHQDKEILSDINFSNTNQFKSYILSHQGNNRAEFQADEFAGRFLVPLEILRYEYDQLQQRMAAADPLWHEIAGMRDHIAKQIAPRFGVDRQVIATRFEREGIWPIE